MRDDKICNLTLDKARAMINRIVNLSYSKRRINNSEDAKKYTSRSKNTVETNELCLFINASNKDLDDEIPF